MKKSALGLIGAICFLFSHSVWASDTASADLTLYTHTAELKPILSSFQLAKSTFLPDRFEDLGLSNYKTFNANYNAANCDAYPLSSCPAGTNCQTCPFNAKRFKALSCTAPYILSGGNCVCPAQVSLSNTNDRCTKYCGSTCIAKSCTPTANQTGCTNGTTNCANGCGANTRKCCVACTNKITSKPANSSYTYSSCYDGSSKQIQTGWKCNSGYHQSGTSCIKDCIANTCSGYTLASCPANANCSPCTITATSCATSGTKYKISSCQNGYTISGNTCIKAGIRDCSALQAAFNAASDGDTVSLSADITCTDMTLSATKNIKLNGAGHTLTFVNSAHAMNQSALDFWGNTITDLTINVENYKGYRRIYTTGSIPTTLNNVTVYTKAQLAYNAFLASNPIIISGTTKFIDSGTERSSSILIANSTLTVASNANLQISTKGSEAFVGKTLEVNGILDIKAQSLDQGIYADKITINKTGIININKDTPNITTNGIITDDITVIGELNINSKQNGINSTNTMIIEGNVNINAPNNTCHNINLKNGALNINEESSFKVDSFSQEGGILNIPNARSITINNLNQTGGHATINANSYTGNIYITSGKLVISNSGIIDLKNTLQVKGDAIVNIKSNHLTGIGTSISTSDNAQLNLDIDDGLNNYSQIILTGNSTINVNSQGTNHLLQELQLSDSAKINIKGNVSFESVLTDKGTSQYNYPQINIKCSSPQCVNSTITSGGITMNYGELNIENTHPTGNCLESTTVRTQFPRTIRLKCTNSRFLIKPAVGTMIESPYGLYRAISSAIVSVTLTNALNNDNTGFTKDASQKLTAMPAEFTKIFSEGIFAE